MGVAKTVTDAAKKAAAAAKRAMERVDKAQADRMPESFRKQDPRKRRAGK